MLRRAIHRKLGIPWTRIQLERTESGKPYLSNKLNSEADEFYFNVSHYGDYTVLAASDKYQVMNGKSNV